ncbi:recombination regulator RecX [Luteimonas aestuarii]|uniref:Regulatory protein RecX n=1 Tax=Luteimonas aestuarii TaxID=453837 RepID=A0A4R5U490_9GAMM|nr:recombination regulator RecX [Luteimonas aestuarii]TDK28527.1 recombination regulator RecX [Luteimonas aestuarii]
MSEPSRPRRQRAPLTATQRALALLTRREHSRKELTRKLASRGVETTEIEAAVARLAGEGWQDDGRFAESLVRSRVGSGYGPRHIRAELGTHGLDAGTIASAMASFDGDWTDVARDLVRRRFGEDGPTGQAQLRKAAELLIRRGFDGDTIRIATRVAPEEAGD